MEQVREAVRESPMGPPPPHGTGVAGSADKHSVQQPPGSAFPLAGWSHYRHVPLCVCTAVQGQLSS